jgi:hypothetical protein
MKDFCWQMEPLKVAVLYVHVPADLRHHDYARIWAATYRNNAPGYPHELFVICNGGDIAPELKAEVFSGLNGTKYFPHDDSGWDIGAYQKFCKQSTHDMVVFLGGSTYLRRPNWLLAMVESFLRHGPNNLYGAMGNNGVSVQNVFPHLRSTAFWCSPELMNSYPYHVTDPHQRYPFEHGPHCFTQWVRDLGYKALAVDAEGEHEAGHFNDSPNGFHRGNQGALLVGDRLSSPPYYPYP